MAERWGGKPWLPRLETTSTSVPATDGSFIVHAVARDTAENVGTADVTVNVDSAPPVITVTEPADGFITKNSSVHLAGRVTDASAVTMTLNGQPLTLASSVPTLSFEIGSIRMKAPVARFRS